MTFYDYSPDLVKDKGSEQANTTGDTGDFGDEKLIFCSPPWFLYHSFVICPVVFACVFVICWDKCMTICAWMCLQGCHVFSIYVTC